MIAQVKIGNVWISPYKAKAKYLFKQKFEFLSFDFWESYLCLPLCICIHIWSHITALYGGQNFISNWEYEGGEGVRTYFNIGLSFSTHNLNLFPIKNWQRVNLWYFLNLIYSRIHIFKFQMSTHWVAKIWDWKIRVCGKYSVSLSRLFRNRLS